MPPAVVASTPPGRQPLGHSRVRSPHPAVSQGVAKRLRTRLQNRALRDKPLVFLHSPPLHIPSTEIEQKRNIFKCFQPFLSGQAREVEQKQQGFPALRIVGKPKTLFVRSFGKRKLTFSWCHSRASALSVRCLFALVNPELPRHPRVTAGETEHEGNKSSVVTEKGRRRCSSFSPHARSAGTYPEGSFLRHRHCSSARNTNKMPISRR